MAGIFQIIWEDSSNGDEKSDIEGFCSADEEEYSNKRDPFEDDYLTR